MIPPDIQQSEDARKNWRTINGALVELRRAIADTGRTADSVQNLRRITGRQITDRYPFRVYRTPPSLRLTADANWWRKFTVQHGYVNNVKTATTDDADGEWGVNQTIEIVVPSGSAHYYIWVDSTLSGSNVTANTIQSGPAPWPGFPNQTQTNKFSTLLARIDTLTNLALKQAIIRQFVYEDIILPGAGTGGTGITFQGDYDPTRTYAVNDLVVIRGSITAGTYLCVVAPPIGLSSTDPSWGVYWVTLSGGLGWL